MNVDVHSLNFYVLLRLKKLTARAKVRVLLVVVVTFLGHTTRRQKLRLAHAAEQQAAATAATNAKKPSLLTNEPCPTCLARTL